MVPEIPVRRFSVDEYWRMLRSGILNATDDVELLEGWVTPMSPHNPPHDGTVTIIQQALEPLLPSGTFIRIQSAVTTEDSAPEPDLAVVKGPPRKYLKRHPAPADVLLVVEVSDSTLEIDRRTKCRVYSRAGIPAYWIVNLTDSLVESFSKPRSTGASPAYREKKVYGVEDAVPVILDGKSLGTISVADLL